MVILKAPTTYLFHFSKSQISNEERKRTLRDKRATSMPG